VTPAAEAPPREPLSAALIAIFAVACGIAVGSLYYSQPLLDALGKDFGVTETATSLIVTVTQLGYAAGLIFIAPLGDLVENRRLVLAIFCAACLALIAVAASRSYSAFLVGSVALGFTAVVAQVLVPLAAHFAAPEKRGEVVGRVVSGLLIGILVARAFAGVVAGSFGWRAVYVVAAVLVGIVTLSLARVLPQRKGAFAGGYPTLLGSMLRIYRTEPLLRRRAAYQFAMFGAFSIFWTSITFLLSSPAYRLSETQIGLFALAGATGALIAPIAGKLGDRGHGRGATGVAFALCAVAFLLTLVHGLVPLVGCAILLDLAVQSTLVIGQQAIYTLRPEERSRLNTLYIATFFVGGAAGSALAGVTYARFHWAGIIGLGVSLPLLAFLFWLGER
jgi:predicted MFS family arabinose efflux permease